MQIYLAYGVHQNQPFVFLVALQQARRHPVHQVPMREMEIVAPAPLVIALAPGSISRARPDS